MDFYYTYHAIIYDLFCLETVLQHLVSKGIPYPDHGEEAVQEVVISWILKYMVYV